jgi:preprotein translocase subunit YajC
MSFSLISSAYAQAQSGAVAATAVAKQPDPWMSFLPFIVIFAIFYFLMIRPQKKKMNEEQKMLGALQKGDEVYMKSGVLGVIAGINDKVVTLEVAEGVKVKFMRSQVGGLSAKLLADEPKKESKK